MMTATTITLTSLDIFEYTLTDQELIDSVLLDCEDREIQWYASNSTAPERDLCHVGYKPNLKIAVREELIQWVEQRINEVSQTLMPRQQLTVNDAWLVRTQFGEGSIRHNHANSVFSALLYLTDDARSGATRFFYKHPMSHKYGFPLKSDIWPELVKEIQPKKGRLIIWPSHIEHDIKPHRSLKPRYTVAFNSWFSGRVCDQKTGLLYQEVRRDIDFWDPKFGPR